MMFSSGSTGVNWDAWYSPSDYAGSDVSCVLVTVSFERPTGLIKYTTDGITGMDGANFEFSAPANADSLCVRLYTLSGGSWEQLDSFERQFQSSTSGALECSVDGETGTLSYGVRMHEDVEFVPMEHELGISERGWLGAYLAGTYFPAVNEEVALVMFSDAAKSGDQPGVEAFARPQDITDDGHTYYCLTMTFLSSETETDPFWTASPQPTTQQEVQSAELVGFMSAFDAGDSYEDIASAWVHDYASNLVLGLPNDDPAACSGVSIGEYSVVAASLTQPERIIVNVSLECEPRDRDAFQEFYGDIVYGLPLAGQSGRVGVRGVRHDTPPLCDAAARRHLRRLHRRGHGHAGAMGLGVVRGAGRLGQLYRVPECRPGNHGGRAGCIGKLYSDGAAWIRWLDGLP